MMKRFTFPQPAPSEITPKADFLKRREFMKVAGAASLATMAGGISGVGGVSSAFAQGVPKLDFSKSEFSIADEPNPLEDITTYNNFYEFGTGKDDPSDNAGALTTRPWSIKIDGMVNKPAELGIEDLLANFDLEERIYRLRCVEAWSMVVPWIGIPLVDVLKAYEPQGSAKYVSFETLVRPEEMIGQKRFGGIEWPYVEGLRLDEAMHPLTILAVGLYGDLLPNQNGAPVRLVVPWKYGFKSIKSVVRISLTEKQPPTSWNKLLSDEYGFYSNVNPEVDHPRWSQKRERIIGSGLFAKKRDTDMFNGYAEQVAPLYAGMDLTKSF